MTMPTIRTPGATALLTALSLTACSGSSSTPTPKPTPQPTPTLMFTTVDTIAGQVGVRGSKDGPGSAATFNYPVGLAATGAAGATNGEVLLYIAGLTENIRYAQVGYAGDPVGTAIGRGESGSVDGDATTAKVRAPQGIAVGYDSPAYEAYAYWTEDDSCVVRKLTAYPLNGNRKAVTVAGQPYACGAADGPVASAKFNRPVGIVANTRTGEVFVADTGNRTLRRIYGAAVSTLAGVAGQSGSADGVGGAARFTAPSGLAMDRQENLYVTDYVTVRRITATGEVSTVAGTPGTTGFRNGKGSEAQFGRLSGIAVDENGTVYVADTGNHCIRRIIPDGTVSTAAGLCGVAGAADGNINAATFDEPVGLAYHGKRLYVSDSTSQTIRRIR
ncbi:MULTISPECIES: hypothetical protein [Deinococcus]|uniref:NHL repeat-containing protein n=1 Tax=Deinococcus rufus TaxID=2136097 RepID=A0ABV7ZH15_9DEIO|nr:hypothetical protein [Deinococcus sp. AB2017081]WQE96960.1 hypothetical protein U2P90_08660 [Deinococcus sp. AB2017081]